MVRSVVKKIKQNKGIESNRCATSDRVVKENFIRTDVWMKWEYKPCESLEDCASKKKQQVQMAWDSNVLVTTKGDNQESQHGEQNAWGESSQWCEGVGPLENGKDLGFHFE